MQISLLRSEHQIAYDTFVAHRPEALLYHSRRYMNFLIDLLDCEQMTLLAINDQGQIIGVLPLLAKNGASGKVINSLPYYGSNGGCLSSDISSKNALIAHYQTILNNDVIAAATIIENPFDRMDPAAIQHDFIDERIGQFTPINYDANHADGLMTSFHYKTRNMIRKAEKLGVKVTVENDQLEFVQKVHTENMLEIGGQSKSTRFFELIPRHFQPITDYRIHVARLDDEPVAAVLCFYFNNTVEYYTPVVRKEYRETQALSAAIFSAMVQASQEGYRWWNWGGTWLTQEGVYRFKKRWGTKDFPYRYFTHLRNHDFLKLTPGKILTEYSSFYILPFSSLKKI